MDHGVNYYLSGIIKEIGRLQQRHYKKYDSKPLIAFRGEPKDFDKTKLMPSIFRNLKYVSKEKYLFELFCDYELIGYEKRNIDKAIETQHYAAISRMLDITFNAAVALYFACSECTDCDGFVYIFCFPEYYSPHSKYIEDFYTDVLNAKKIKTYFKNFKVFSHSYSNDRIKAQSGGFIFFPGETYSPINDGYYKKVMIQKDDKERVLRDLEDVFHINKARLFPEKDKIAEIIKTKFIQNDYLDEELTVRSEIMSCFNRISYEINILLDIYDKTTILRYLRKEKEDLLIFLNNQFSKKNINGEEEYNSLKSLIEDTFDFYSQMI